MTADWTIWAFRYARSDMPRDFFGGTLVNSNKGRINNPMVYSLIHGGEAGAERPILIDTGMKGDWSPSGKTYENVEHPDTILAKVGFVPEDIEDVILTHLHFDHAGNLDRFPNATFHVQRAEYEGWKRVYEMPGDLGIGYHHVAAIIDAEKGSRHCGGASGGRPGQSAGRRYRVRTRRLVPTGL